MAIFTKQQLAHRIIDTQKTIRLVSNQLMGLEMREAELIIENCSSSSLRDIKEEQEMIFMILSKERSNLQHYKTLLKRVK